MNASNRTTPPAWSETPPPRGTLRSIFKWGDPHTFKHPSTGFFSVIQSALNLPDTQFEQPVHTGLAQVGDLPAPKMPPDVIDTIARLVGPDNISTAAYDRIRYAKGKSMEDILRLRHNCIEQVCDLVVHPRDKSDVAAVMTVCHDNGIPLHVYGGGSSVTAGLDCPKGGVTLVMGTHMNRVLSFNEMDQTITVEPGMIGPVYEDLLNHAPDRLDAANAYTGGHFPQSFEYSSVGGWVAAAGSGQASSLYGDAGDLVISQEYVTPAGSFKTHAYPACATGPKINDIMKGSEGCFGVLVAVTFKIFTRHPGTEKPFGFMFPDFDHATRAARQISQGRFGMPAILRISDAEETDVAMQMYHLSGGFMDRYLSLRGAPAGKRCLLMGETGGQRHFSRQVYRRIKQVCRQNHGISLTGLPMKKWSKSRFADPYMRDALNDYGILIDTLETAVTWDQFHEVHQGVRQFIKSRSPIICMTHASHFYSQGTNLYFIFIMPMDTLASFRSFQRGIISAIEQHGGALSHHHGIGRTMAPWMPKHLGKEQMAILRCLKSHFDPKGILNPGGLGL